MHTIKHLTSVELKLITREPFTLLFVFVFPIVVLLVLSGVFGTEATEEWQGTTPANYYAASYIGTVIAALALISVPSHLAAYRERGILRRLTASSVSAQAVLLSQLIVGFLLALGGSLALILAATLIYDVEMPVSIGGMILSFTVGALSFVTLGLLLGSVVPTARSAQAIGLGLFFPMWMLSGTGPPPDVMSDTMRSISDVLPMTRLVSALQAPWFGDGVTITELVILVGILIIAGAAAVYRLRAADQ
ncbi:MAG: ABC transporter permease [Sphaerobacteraceae bacterium]|nr:MAG: ABC transporter permease [Sphaerobacteraceae bacterium]